MRSYLDGYFDSLTAGQRILAETFVWNDRRQIGAIDGAGNLSPSKALKVTTGSLVRRSDFEHLFDAMEGGCQTLFDQCNKSANIRDTLKLQGEAKLNRISAALKALEHELDDWEYQYTSKPQAVNNITRSFGPAGLRPILEDEGNLQLLFTVVQANVPVTYSGGAVKASMLDSINQSFFSDATGLQVRYTAYFVPGLVNRISLDPITSAGDALINAMRAYGANGELIATLAVGEKLDRSLEYSVPKTLLSRIELDLIDPTFNLVDTPVIKRREVTGEYRIVIPATQINRLSGWKDVSNTTTYGILDPHDPREDLMLMYPGLNLEPSFLRMEPVYSTVCTALNYEYAGAYISRYYAHYYDTHIIETVNSQTPIWSIVQIPEQILMEDFTYQEDYKSIEKRYNYELGLANFNVGSDFYTEVMHFAEEVKLSSGMPSVITLTTDEFLPSGSYINLFLKDRAGNVIPLIPENREYTTDVLRFNQYGQAELNFFPAGDTHFYKNQEEETGFELHINGKSVMGPSANMGSINTVGNAVSYWCKYEPDKTRANLIPVSSRAALFVNKEGSLGEVFPSIPQSKMLNLQGMPFVDDKRLDEDNYSPVTIAISGYNTLDVTNYRELEEDEFPVLQEYTGTTKILHYKVRGKTIFFEFPVARQVKVFYESTEQYVTILGEMGIIHGNAACPVLYQYSLSYI